MKDMRISVLVSGGGTDLQSIIDAIEEGRLPRVRICQVIASRPDAYALERAKKHAIPARVLSRKDYEDETALMEALTKMLDEEKTELVVLAGYLQILSGRVLERYAGRIINIHPSLLPKYGGKDCYGMRVHRQVIAAGDKESGATVHYVDEGIDSGRIILQKKVLVYEGDTAEALQQRVLALEHQMLPEAIGIIEKERE